MMIRETELKFRVDDLDGVRRSLPGFGAVKVKFGLERNLVFDRDGEFIGSDRLLRLRDRAGKAILTYKGKSERDGMKSRPEINVEVGDFGKAKAFLESIGFSVSWIYEIRRELWKVQGVEVCIDETPIGNFVEIEGGEEDIIAAAKSLGFDLGKRITSTYWDLFLEHREKTGDEGRDMVFRDA